MIHELALITMLDCAECSSKAASPTADYIRSILNSSYEHRLNSYTFGNKINSIMDNLDKIVHVCSEEGWDGYAAKPIAAETISNAKIIISVLPYDIHTPEISAESDGHITLEWYRSSNNVLSISISPENDIHYAALIGSSKAYGTEPFKGTFPKTSTNLIQLIFSL